MLRRLLKCFVMKLWYRRQVLLPGLGALLGIAMVAYFIVSCSTSDTIVLPPDSVEGAEFVGSQSCARCHEEISTVFPGSVHARVNLKARDGLDIGCESCHGPGSRHVESGGGTAFDRLIVNPRTSNEACFKCHLGVHSQFRLPHRHPVVEGFMHCTQCHDPHGHDIMNPATALRFSTADQSCADCHQEQSRPFVFEHEAMREGCTTCHHPHGSVNDKLLIQPDANLCLRCHSQVAGTPGRVVIGQVDHSLFLRQGNCSTSGCHTAVHGSNVHPRLFY